MSEGLMLVYGWGPEEDGKLSSLLYIAETALAMGIKTQIFFYTDSAILGKRGNLAKVSMEIYDRFNRISDNSDASIYLCEEAAKKRGINSENLEEKMHIVGYATFLDLAMKSKTVITI